MTAHTYGWSDLDTANRQHYGRGKPKELLDAEWNMEVASDAMEKAVDEYYDLHYGETEYLAKMRAAMKHLQSITDEYRALSVKYGYLEPAELEPINIDEIPF